MIGGCRDGQGLPRCERSRRGFLLSAYGAVRSMPDAGRLAMPNRRRFYAVGGDGLRGGFSVVFCGAILW